jgi:hypothetical protein
MTGNTLCAVSYQQQHAQVSWRGVNMVAGPEFDDFLQKEVASRLHDDEGAGEFEACLRGLAVTGFAQNSLDAVLAASVSEARDWAIGEALAETFLSQQHGIVWPWNMARDKRTASASLPGADLVGFDVNGERVRLALGEVKTSRDADTPPNVMNGRSGMAHQLDNLAVNLALVAQLLRWLMPRCQGVNATHFRSAVALLLESGNKAISLFGVLVRDTPSNELDLKSRGRTLGGRLQAPTTCHLIAIYLPCTIADLPSHVSGGAS